MRNKILKLIYDNGEAHIGSCMSCVEMVGAIYKIIKPQDKFILSKSHALRTVEAFGYIPQFVKEVCPYGGSLGNGIGIGVGMAIANPESRIYVLCGDGEMDEGSVWEAIRYIDTHYLSNIKILIDFNRFTSLREIGISHIKNINICDGHDENEIIRSIENNQVTVCRTVKGKGIPMLENTLESHYKKLTKEEYDECANSLSNG